MKESSTALWLWAMPDTSETKLLRRPLRGLIGYGSSCVAAVTQQLFYLFHSVFSSIRADESKCQFILHGKYEKSLFYNALGFFFCFDRK